MGTLKYTNDQYVLQNGTMRIKRHSHHHLMVHWRLKLRGHLNSLRISYYCDPRLDGFRLRVVSDYPEVIYSQLKALMDGQEGLSVEIKTYKPHGLPPRQALYIRLLES